MIDEPEDDVVEREETEPETPEAPVEGDIEATARRLGWRPESEWTGTRKPPKFLSAQEFIDKVENDLPVLRERLRHQGEEVGKLTTQVADLSGKLTESTGLIKTLVDQNRETGKRAYDKAKRELAAEKRAAVEAADTGAFDAAEARERELDEQNKTAVEPERAAPVVQPTRQVQPTVDPITAAWIADNKWFTDDPVLNAYARSENNRIWKDAEANGETLSKLDALVETKKSVVEKFPEKFGINPRRNGKGAVATPTPRNDRQQTNGHAFDDLPEEARQTYERLRVQFKDRGEDYKKEDYVADYQW